MKKIIAAGAISVLLSTSALATELNAKLQGRFQFEAAGVNQSKLKGDEKNVSAHKKKFGTESNAFVGVRVEASKDDLKYGAQISLQTSTNGTSTPAYERSHIFLETNYGKFEFGSNFDAATMMELNALTYARATGDHAQNYIMSDVKEGSNVGDNIQLFQYNFCDLNNKREAARKVTYYTPKMGGFQAGISYIPDSTNYGNLTVNDKIASESKGTDYGVLATNSIYRDFYAAKDLWTAGLSYDHHIDDNTSMKLGLSGEYGKSAKKGLKVPGNAPQGEYKMPDVKTYNLGAAFTTGPYTLVGSYTDFGKRGSDEVFGSDNKKNKMYSLGGVYKQGPLGASISYFNTTSHGNKMNTVVLGTDYAFAPGLLPYAEVAFFNGKAKLPKIYGDNTKKKFRGAVLLLGTKLMF